MTGMSIGATIGVTAGGGEESRVTEALTKFLYIVKVTNDNK